MNRKHVIKICVLVLAIVTGIVIFSVSFAAYTKSSRAKRVVAPISDTGMLFSSNYLSLHTQGVINKRTLYTSTTTSVSSHISVCNYAQKNRTKVYDSDIVYNLSCKLVVVEGNEMRDATSSDVASGLEVTISINDTTVTLNNSNLSGSINNNRLSHINASMDVFNVAFSESFTDRTNPCLYINATPVGSYSGIQALDGVFSPKTAVNSNAQRWNGHFNDEGAISETGEPLPTAYDGFNYVINGSGAGTATLKWKTSAVVPNMTFTLGKTITVDGEFSKVTFNVDSNEIDTYEIQFFKVYETTDSFESWDIVNEYVEFIFEAN